MDTNGLRPGEESEGCFTLCTDLGEYALPYRIRIQSEKEIRENARASGTKELARMAREDFQAAYPVFVSPEFAQSLKKNGP